MFARLRELAGEHGLRHLSMGTSQDYRVAAEEGATIVRIGHRSCTRRLRRLAGKPRSGANPNPPWPSATPGTASSSTSASPRTATRTTRSPSSTASPRQSSRTATASARTCAASRRAAAATTSTTSSPTRRRASAARRRCASVAPPGNGTRDDVRVHLVIPKSFNDAQDVADKFKDSIPVIINLQGIETRPLQAPDRLRLRPHLRARRRHAADRRQGVPAHPAQRRGVRRGARSPDREGLLQPVLTGWITSGAMQVGFIGAGNMARALARGWGDPVLCTDSGSGARPRWRPSSAARRSRPTRSWPSAPIW